MKPITIKFRTHFARALAKAIISMLTITILIFISEIIKHGV